MCDLRGKQKKWIFANSSTWRGGHHAVLKCWKGPCTKTTNRKTFDSGTGSSWHTPRLIRAPALFVPGWPVLGTKGKGKQLVSKDQAMILCAGHLAISRHLLHASYI